MKTCSSCNKTKDPSDFRRDSSTKDGLQPRCKECASARTKQGYMEKYGEGARARTKARSTAHRNRISSIKRQLGCRCCPETEPCCLEFHHLDPNYKEFQLSDSSISWKRLREEIEKCICVCSNCHRKIHAGLLTP